MRRALRHLAILWALPVSLPGQTLQQRIAAVGTVFWLAQAAGKAPALALNSIALDDSEDPPALDLFEETLR
jgi:hypothetical protein